MVTKSELEGMRQELRELAGERMQLRKTQEDEIDRFHSQWALKLKQVKIEGTDRIKPYRAKKENDRGAIRAALLAKLDMLDGAKRIELKEIEKEYQERKKRSQQNAERQIEDTSREFEKHSKRLAEELTSEVASCEKERDAALDALKAEQDKAMATIQDKIKSIEQKVAAVRAS